MNLISSNSKKDKETYKFYINDTPKNKAEFNFPPNKINTKNIIG